MASPALKLETNPRVEEGLFGSPGKRRVVLSLLLGLLTLAVYNLVAQNGFVSYDDPDYITRNQHVQAGLSWPTVLWAMTSTEQANWHPLTWLSHALDCQLFHLRPVGHHFMTLLLHALTAVLWFLFLERATGLAFRSAVVAALFAIHPVNVESVAWAAERKNVLCTLFFVLGLWAYRWYAQNPSPKRYLIVAGAYVLGLMSKPMLVTFPFVLLLMDYWPLARVRFSDFDTTAESREKFAAQPFARLVAEKLPLFALSAGSAVITMIAQRRDDAIRGEHSFSERAANAIVSYARYLGKAVWPSHLAAIYPFPLKGLPTWEVVGATILILLITAAVLMLKQKRYLAFGWFWFLGTLVPTIGLVQVGGQAMADRYAYIPFLGLFIAVVWGLADWAGTRKHSRACLSVAAVTAIVGFSVAAHIQIGYWQNTLALWTHTLSVTHNNFIAENNLGAALLGQSKVREARQHFQAGIDINPEDPRSLLDIGICDMDLGNAQSAVEHYQAALRVSHDPMLRALAFSNLGTIYRTSGDYAAAAENYIASLALAPQNALALYGMGLVAQKTGKLDQAIVYYSNGVQVGPSDVGLVLLAQALAKHHRNTEAQTAFAKARKLSQDIDAATQAAGELLTK
jgi:protein O-mannosyl-transferase